MAVLHDLETKAMFCSNLSNLLGLPPYNKINGKSFGYLVNFE